MKVFVKEGVISMKAKYHIFTTTIERKRWKNIWINGIKTPYEINRKGDVRNTITKSKRKPQLYKDGYKFFVLHFDGKRTNVSHHRLLACIFIPIPKRYTEMGLTQLDLEVNHKDGIKGHDTLNNLEWCTESENQKHAVNLGLKSTGSKLSFSTPENKIREVMLLLEQGCSFSKIKKVTGVSKKVSSHIYHGNHWSNYIRKEYNIAKRDLSKYNTSKDEVVKICEMLESGMYTIADISKKLNIDSDIVSGIKTGDNYKEISKDYDFSNVPNGRTPFWKTDIVLTLIHNGYTSEDIHNKTDYSIDLIDNMRNHTVHNILYEEDYYNGKMSEKQALAICELLEDGKSNDEIMKTTNSSSCQITDIKNHKTYTNISNHYNF